VFTVVNAQEPSGEVLAESEREFLGSALELNRKDPFEAAG
jgi:hypothetical protein